MLATINLVTIDGTGIHIISEAITLAILLIAVWGAIAVPILIARGVQRRRLESSVRELTHWIERLTPDPPAPPPPPPPG